MKRTNIVMLLMVFGILALTAASAFAFDLGGYVGPIKLKFEDWTIGRQYPTINQAGEFVPENNGRAGLSNGAQNIPVGGNVGDDNSDGVEDSWGILSLTGIYSPTSSVALWAPSTNEYIKGVMYGFDDAYLAPSSTGGVDIGQVGGYLDLYLGTKDLDPTKSPTLRATDPYNATEGVQFVRLLAVPGIVEGTDYTRWEHANGLTSPFSGDGSGYFEVVQRWGGYDSVFAPGRVYAQFDFSTKNRQLFDANSHDPAWTVPEPASMALLSIGLVGVAALKRKKAA